MRRTDGRPPEPIGENFSDRRKKRQPFQRGASCPLESNVQLVPFGLTPLAPHRPLPSARCAHRVTGEFPTSLVRSQCRHPDSGSVFSSLVLCFLTLSLPPRQPPHELLVHISSTSSRNQHTHGARHRRRIAASINGPRRYGFTIGWSQFVLSVFNQRRPSSIFTHHSPRMTHQAHTHPLSLHSVCVFLYQITLVADVLSLRPRPVSRAPRSHCSRARVRIESIVCTQRSATSRSDCDHQVSRTKTADH